MKKFIFVVVFMFLAGCAVIKPHEKLAQEKATQSGLIAVAKPRFNATFVSPAIAFSKYNKMIVEGIDLSNAKIIEPNRKNSFDPQWVLTDEDKQYYQSRYSESAQKYMFDSGLFAPSQYADTDTLILKAKITEIFPLAPKDDLKSRPNLVKIYTQGFGRMTIVFELYDSTTYQLVAIATDEQELGRRWELNNKVQNNIQVRKVFDYWFSKLKHVLNDATQK